MTDVRRDAELLNALLDECLNWHDRTSGKWFPFNVKTLVLWTGLSVQTISDYRTGKTNIPIEFWRRILEHNIDVRIIALLTPVDCTFELQCNGTTGPASPPEFFKAAVKAEGEHHEQMKYVAEMLADGRIDDMDAATVQAYADAFHRHRVGEAMLHKAILTTFNRQMERKAGAR